VRDGGGAGYPTHQWDCLDVRNQHFVFSRVGTGETYTISPVHDRDLCLEQSWDNQAGRWAVVNPCSPFAQRQTWTLSECALGRSSFPTRLTNWASRHSLGAENGGTSNGTRFVSQPATASEFQQLRVEQSGAGCDYRIVLEASERCADVKDRGGVGEPVHQWDCVGVPNQLFRFEHLGADRYTIRPLHRPDLCLEQSWDDQPGRWIIVNPCREFNERQVWVFTSALSTTPLRVTTFNMCGNAGKCPQQDFPRVKVASVLHQVLDLHGSDVVFLQEVCSSHVRLLRQALPAWGILFTAFDDTADEQVRCNRAGGEYGLALLYRGGYLYDHVMVLPAPVHPPGTDPKEVRRMLCGQPLDLNERDGARPVDFCGVHLSTSDEDPSRVTRTAQVVAIRDYVRAEVALGFRVLLGGDFNSAPPQPSGESIMTPLYAEGAECAAGEPHQGAPTKDDRKIDYLFGFGDIQTGPCTPYAASTSDHRLLHGTVRY
jgi:endonuclease/exonuclease/phosphatase family metal-dependent hydrolase